MASDESAANSLAYGLSLAGAARAEADNANRRALDAEGRAMRAELEAASKTTNRDLERRLDEANSRQRVAEGAAAALIAELKERNALITEWMHSNEAFKRLARQYGKKLGLSDEEEQDNVNNMIVDVAEEDPQFAKTDLGSRARERLNNKAK